jgi:predicted DNA-binding transcriptional regulator AlpA
MIQSNPLADLGLLTVKQVARRLAVSVRTVWRGVAAGRFPLPCYPCPRSPRWREADIRHYLAGLTQRTPS